MRVKIVPSPPKLDFGFEMSSGASGGPGGPDVRAPAGSVEEGTLRQAGTPGGFSVPEKAQVAAARSSTGVEEGDDSRIEFSDPEEEKAPQAALGEGESVYPNLNDHSLSQQPVDLLTVDGLHDAAAGGALNVYSKGLSVDQREMDETDEAGLFTLRCNNPPGGQCLRGDSQRAVAHGCQLSSSRSLHATQDRTGLNSTAQDSERQSLKQQNSTTSPSDSGWPSTDQWWW